MSKRQKSEPIDVNPAVSRPSTFDVQAFDRNGVSS